MKSKEFLIEGVTLENIEEWATLIKEDCQYYLNQNNPKNSPLYRGLGTSNKPFLKKRVRLNNRNPKDTHQYIHNKINKSFVEDFGAPFRNSMFCTGDAYAAANYGDVYHIFPRGKFEFLWSPNIDDLFSLWDLHDGDDDEDEFFKHFRYGNYTNRNLNDGINSKHEIMLRCNSYYALLDNNDTGLSKIINLL